MKAKLKKLDEKMAKDGALGWGQGGERGTRMLSASLVQLCVCVEAHPPGQPSTPCSWPAGTKAQDLQAELERLQEDVPALQARAADLELQLAKAQEVRPGGSW